MNKIKFLFLAVALVLGLGSVYAFSAFDEPECLQANYPGYSTPTTTGNPAPPPVQSGAAYLGLYGQDFSCINNPDVECHFIYKAGVWYRCTGEFTIE